MVLSCIYGAFAFGFASLAFLIFGWWVYNARCMFKTYVPQIETVARSIVNFGNDEDPAEYIKRIKSMSDDELMREIKIIIQYTEWGNAIVTAVSELKASVPFIGDGGK